MQPSIPLTLFLAIGCLVPRTAAQDEPAAQQIEQACLDYVEGFYDGDVERLARGVHPSLQKVTLAQASPDRQILEGMDRHTLTEYARLGVVKRAPAERDIDVKILAVLENIALARIACRDFVDHVQVARINGAWMIINALWMRHTPRADVPALDEQARAALVQAGMDYVDGFYAGSPERMAMALHPRLQKVMVQKLPNGREFFRYTTTDGLIEYSRAGMGRKPEAERKVEVTVLEASGNIASLRVNSADFVDFVHVARINGEWKIVNVIWVPKSS